MYLLDGRSLDSIKTDPEELRDRSLLTFNPPDIEKMQIDLDGKQWIATKDKDNKWTLEKPEKKEKLDNWPYQAYFGILRICNGNQCPLVSLTTQRLRNLISPNW